MYSAGRVWGTHLSDENSFILRGIIKTINSLMYDQASLCLLISSEKNFKFSDNFWILDLQIREGQKIGYDSIYYFWRYSRARIWNFDIPKKKKNTHTHTFTKWEKNVGQEIDPTVCVMLDAEWNHYSCYTPVNNIVRFISSIKWRLSS